MKELLLGFIGLSVLSSIAVAKPFFSETAYSEAVDHARQRAHVRGEQALPVVSSIRDIKVAAELKQGRAASKVLFEGCLKETDATKSAEDVWACLAGFEADMIVLFSDTLSAIETDFARRYRKLTESIETLKDLSKKKQLVQMADAAWTSFSNCAANARLRWDQMAITSTYRLCTVDFAHAELMIEGTYTAPGL